MTSRLTPILGSSIILLLVLGAGLRNQYLIFASVPLFTLVALIKLFAINPNLNVEVKVTPFHTSIYEGESAEFNVDVHNLGPAVGVVDVLVVIPSELELKDGTNHYIGSLQEGESVQFAFSVSPRVFGVHRLGPVRVRTLDILGSFVEQMVVDFTFDLKVYPEVQYTSQIRIKPRNPRSWPGEILTRKTGMGMEFYGLRSYEPTDPVRKINWKASSRSEELLTNLFMSEFGGDTVVVLDARSVSVLGTPPNSTITYATRAAAVVVYRLLRDRNRVGMIALGSRLDKVSPGFGRKQFDRLLTSMIGIKPGNIWDIRNLAAYLSIFFSRQTQIVVITPLMDDNSYEAVAEISAKGYPLLVISPSPVEFEVQYMKRGEIERIAEKLVRLERETKLSLLRRHAAVVDWNVREPLAQALKQMNQTWVKAR